MIPLLSDLQFAQNCCLKSLGVHPGKLMAGTQKMEVYFGSDDFPSQLGDF